jgi:hypothetical protein
MIGKRRLIEGKKSLIEQKEELEDGECKVWFANNMKYWIEPYAACTCEIPIIPMSIQIETNHQNHHILMSGKRNT